MLVKFRLFSLLLTDLLLSLIKSEELSPCPIAQECYFNKTSSEKIMCSTHGKCVYDGSQIINGVPEKAVYCQCALGYTNSRNDSEVKCCYKQKSQHIAFLHECLGLGIGHYYRGNKELFKFKLVTMTGSFCVILIFALCNWFRCGCLQSKNLNCFFKLVVNLIIIACAVYIIVFQISDLFLFAANKYPDENGVDLKHW